MAEYIPTQKEKRSFKDLVFDQWHKIMELSCDEFIGGYTQKQSKGNFIEEVYIPDARKRISQAIEFFSFLLQPLYDKDMKNKSSNIKKDVRENLNKFNDEKINRETFRVNKLNLMKKLFEALNFLLERSGYLKVAQVRDTKNRKDNEDYDD